jgi:hypothetical protein
VLRVLLDELGTNIASAENNQQLLALEVNLLGQLKTIPNDPDELRVGAWTLVLRDLPQQVAEDAELQTELADISRRVEQLNQMMRARLMEKTGGLVSHATYRRTITAHNELIQQFEDELLDKLKPVRARLEAMRIT